MTMIRSSAAILSLVLAATAITAPAYARPCAANSTTCQTVWKGKNSTIYAHDNGTYYECGSSGCKQL